MNLINNGSIVINDNKYKYKIFDTDGLIDIIRHNKKFCDLFLDAIRKYRNTPHFFDIFQLVREYITYRPDSELVYFVIYKNDEIVSMLRFYYYIKKSYGYFNMVYTNPKFRGQGICQNMVRFIIDNSKKYIKKYELEVITNNIPAIKCYERVGFKYIRKVNLSQSSYNLMRLVI
jgi:ribosomal protein S18 acetylase RimI-like enzyme